PEGGPTVFGLQEVLYQQLFRIKFGLGEDWEHVGVARDDGRYFGEFCPIIYNSSQLRVLHNETKWLSQTPNEPSYGWDAGSRRVVTVAVFEHVSTRRRFVAANTH